MIEIEIEYYAFFREYSKIESEKFFILLSTAEELYARQKELYDFPYNTDTIRVAINDAFSSWQTLLNNGDKIVFIAPVSGG